MNHSPSPLSPKSVAAGLLVTVIGGVTVSLIMNAVDETGRRESQSVSTTSSREEVPEQHEDPPSSTPDDTAGESELKSFISFTEGYADDHQIREMSMEELERQGRLVNNQRASLANAMGRLLAKRVSLEHDDPARDALDERIERLKTLDKTLELQLRRIDTQQQALATEIQARAKAMSRE